MLDAFLIGWLLIGILAWYSNDKPRVSRLFTAVQPDAVTKKAGWVHEKPIADNPTGNRR